MLAGLLRLAPVLVVWMAAAVWAQPGPVTARTLSARRVVVGEGPAEPAALRVHPDFPTLLAFESEVVPGSVGVEEPERVRLLVTEGRMVVLEPQRELAEGERVRLWVHYSRGGALKRATLVLVPHASEVDVQVRVVLPGKLARPVEPREPSELMKLLLSGEVELGKRLIGNQIPCHVLLRGRGGGSTLGLPTGQAAGERHPGAQSRGGGALGAPGGVVDEQLARPETRGAPGPDASSPAPAGREWLGAHGLAPRQRDSGLPPGGAGARGRPWFSPGTGGTLMRGTSSASTSAGEAVAGTGPADEAFPRWAPVGMCVGPWRIVRWLGQGGYGVVYLAEDTRPVSAGGVAGPVALKLAAGRTKEEDPQAARRLLREADILRRVAHPQVVRLLGQGEHLGVPYLALEYVAGPDFYDWSSLRNRTARELVERVATLALALHAAHEAGVFHRDLKGDECPHARAGRSAGAAGLRGG